MLKTMTVPEADRMAEQGIAVGDFSFVQKAQSRLHPYRKSLTCHFSSPTFRVYVRAIEWERDYLRKVAI